MKATAWRRLRRLGPVLVTLLIGGVACSEGSLGIVGAIRGDDVELELDGPLSSLGSYRFYDGVRLLECDIRLTALAHGESGSAVWVEAVVDLFDLSTGRYLASDYLMALDLAQIWGASRIEGGERRTSRGLRYNSFGPFRAEFTFRYRSEGSREYGRARHVFHCR